jgi:hypothetical protein
MEHDMKRILRTALTAVALALPVGVAAEARNLAGTPVTAETLVDQVELIRIADAIDAAVDAKDWDLARSLFTDEIEVDFTSLTGGEPATIPADALIAGWRSNLTAEKTSFHLRGNHRITFEGPDAATMLSHGHAWNRLERGGCRRTAARRFGRFGASTSMASSAPRTAGASTP